MIQLIVALEGENNKKYEYIKFCMLIWSKRKGNNIDKTLIMKIGSEAYLPSNECSKADFPACLEPKT